MTTKRMASEVVPPSYTASLSIEEEDAFIQSNKKKKNNHVDTMDTQEEMRTDGNPKEQNDEGAQFIDLSATMEQEESGPTQKASYRDAVTRRENKDVFFVEDKLYWSDDECTMNSAANEAQCLDLNANPKSDNPLKPELIIPTKHLEKLQSKWKDSIIVRLLGRVIGYRALMNKIPSLWNLQGDYEVIDLEEGHYLFKFDMKCDLNHVLTNGPWIINNHYLTVRKWEPFFNPKKASETHTALWVRLPCLSLEFFHEKVLHDIGKLIGEPIKTDTNSAETHRGKFARICVVVDISKPLIPKYLINGVEYDIEYEFLPSLCFKCGMIGHRQDFCPSFITPAKPQSNPPEKIHGVGSNVNNGNEATTSTYSEGNMEPRKETTTETRSDFGPWMMVQRRSRRSPARNVSFGNMHMTGSIPNQRQSNRFSILKDKQTTGNDLSAKRLDGRSGRTKVNEKNNKGTAHTENGKEWGALVDSAMFNRNKRVREAGIIQHVNDGELMEHSMGVNEKNPKPPHVTLQNESSHNGLTVKVADCGNGITQKNNPNINSAPSDLTSVKNPIPLDCTQQTLNTLKSTSTSKTNPIIISPPATAIPSLPKTSSSLNGTSQQCRQYPSSYDRGYTGLTYEDANRGREMSDGNHGGRSRGDTVSLEVCPSETAYTTTAVPSTSGQEGNGEDHVSNINRRNSKNGETPTPMA